MTSESPLKGKAVLLVDDEAEFVSTLAQRLEVRNFAVKTALSGEEAIADLEKQDFDVIILDVLMPGKSGIEVLREIKKLKPLTEVIMLTGQGTIETGIEGMKLGAYDYLLKPAETEELVTKVREAYDRKAGQEERIRKADIDRIVLRRGW